jgi:hypothetical protein
MAPPGGRILGMRASGDDDPAGGRIVPRLTRINFVWRWTILTMLAASLCTLAIVALIERAHREAAEIDYELTSVRRVSAELAGPLDGLADTGRLNAALEDRFRRADADARHIDAVAGLRIYRADGQPVYPQTAAPASIDVGRALAADHAVPVDSGPKLAVYVPYHAHRAQVYVIAVDFVSVQLHATARRGQVFSIAGIVSAVAGVSLVILAAGASQEFERRRREAQAAFFGALNFMAEAIDLRDPYTAGHSRRVAVYSRQLADAIDLPESEAEIVESGALLHDIGKIGVPDAVLFKPGPLDVPERQAIALHPLLGARLLAGVSSMGGVVSCVLHHHERIDGDGYPQGLRGEAIPLSARLVAIADSFDAMTTDRPYRRAMPVEDALSELLRVAGTQLDEHLVRTFVDLVMRGEIVLLDVQARPSDSPRS